MATNSVRNEGLSCNAAEAGKCDIRLQGWKPGAEFGKCQKKKKVMQTHGRTYMLSHMHKHMKKRTENQTKYSTKYTVEKFEEENTMRIHE